MTDAASESEAYHDELGVKEGEDGDLFVVTEDSKTLLTRDEALELAGMLIRNADGGFRQESRQGLICFADMEIKLHTLPDGPGEGERIESYRHEHIDPGLWCWYDGDLDTTIEFAFGKRGGFER